MQNLTPDQDQLLQDVLAFDNEGEAFSDKDVTRDPYTGRIIKSFDGSDSDLNVAFSVEPVLNKMETVLARKRGDLAPKYTDMEFITISAPGKERDTLIHTPVTDYYQWRFPKEYAAFKAGREAAVTGTPLHMWPVVSPSQAKELEFHGIRTVEQVANLSDSISGYQSLKAKAKQFLEGNKEAAQLASVQAELDERDAKHAAELAAMKAQLEQMAELVRATKKSKTSGDAAS